MLTALGVVLGQSVWNLATSAGLSALMLASAPVFAAVRICGAAYLVYLGAHALWGALRSGARSEAARGVGFATISRGAALRQGLLSNVGNPKMAVFFTSLLPQFVSRQATFSDLLLLGAIFSSMTLAWLVAYAFAIEWAGDRLRQSGVRRALDALLGATLVALGLRLATERR
jgi:threonine/homoserine/homoserine lactone efflux protein